MTKRYKDFLGDEILTEGDLEAYCENNGVIQCDYYSELSTLPSGVNAAYVIETRQIYSRTATGWQQLTSKSYVDTADSALSTRITTAQNKANSAFDDAADAQADANAAGYVASGANTRAAKSPETMNAASGGTTALKVYHRNYSTNLEVGPFWLYAKVPLPSAADYKVLHGNAAGAPGGLEVGATVPVWKIVGNYGYFMWVTPGLTLGWYGDEGDSVTVNYVVYYT